MKTGFAKLALLVLFPFAFSNLSCQEDTKHNNYANKSIAYNKTNENQFANVSDKISNSRRNAITEAVRICSPAIVGINVTEIKQVVMRDAFTDLFNSNPMFQRFFGGMRRPQVRNYEVKELGSGYIVSPDGYILTNHHVAGNASKIVVTMNDGNQFDAKIIGSDAVSDVALIKIEGEDLPYLKFANSDILAIGEWAIAFGNPFGLFDINSKPTITVGVVSNTGVNLFHNEGNTFRVYRNMIQTDAAISSGNSGGPLVNADGEVIGMNTIIYSTAQNNSGSGSIGIGFSIPINRVKKIMEVLKSGRELNRNSYTGMDVREIDENIANYLKIKKQRGVVVFSLNRNSPADKAGIEPGDIITEVDGLKVNRGDDYLIGVNDAVVGQKIEIKVMRDEKEISKFLTLEEAPRR